MKYLLSLFLLLPMTAPAQSLVVMTEPESSAVVFWNTPIVSAGNAEHVLAVGCSLSFPVRVTLTIDNSAYAILPESTFVWVSSRNGQSSMFRVDGTDRNEFVFLNTRGVLAFLIDADVVTIGWWSRTGRASVTFDLTPLVLTMDMPPGKQTTMIRQTALWKMLDVCKRQ